MAWASSQHGELGETELGYLDGQASRINVPTDMAEGELPFDIPRNYKASLLTQSVSQSSHSLPRFKGRGHRPPT